MQSCKGAPCVGVGHVPVVDGLGGMLNKRKYSLIDNQSDWLGLGGGIVDWMRFQEQVGCVHVPAIP